MRFVLLFFLFSGCEYFVPQKINPSKSTYIHELKIRVNGEHFVGFALAKFAPGYEIRIRRSTGMMDTLFMTTCHRDVKVEDAGRREYFTFFPTALERDCGFIKFAAYEQDMGRHSFGMIVLVDPQLSLVGELECNGKTESGPHLVCQNLVGLVQRIRFKTPVDLESTCGGMNSSDKQSFEWKVRRGRCIYRFLEIESGKQHELVVWGYEKHLIKDL